MMVAGLMLPHAMVMLALDSGSKVNSVIKLIADTYPQAFSALCSAGGTVNANGYCEILDPSGKALRLPGKGEPVTPVKLAVQARSCLYFQSKIPT